MEMLSFSDGVTDKTAVTKDENSNYWQAVDEPNVSKSEGSGLNSNPESGYLFIGFPAQQESPLRKSYSGPCRVSDNCRIKRPSVLQIATGAKTPQVFSRTGNATLTCDTLPKQIASSWRKNEPLSYQNAFVIQDVPETPTTPTSPTIFSRNFVPETAQLGTRPILPLNTTTVTGNLGPSNYTQPTDPLPSAPYQIKGNNEVDFRPIKRRFYICFSINLIFTLLLMMMLVIFFFVPINHDRPENVPEKWCHPCRALQTTLSAEELNDLERQGEGQCCAISPEQKLVMTRLIVSRKFEEEDKLGSFTRHVLMEKVNGSMSRYHQPIIALQYIEEKTPPGSLPNDIILWSATESLSGGMTYNNGQIRIPRSGWYMSLLNLRLYENYRTQNTNSSLIRQAAPSPVVTLYRGRPRHPPQNIGGKRITRGNSEVRSEWDEVVNVITVQYFDKGDVLYCSMTDKKLLSQKPPHSWTVFNL